MTARASTPGTIPYLLVVFCNAFVDLGHKIIIQNTLFKVYDGPQQVLLIAVVNGLILLPFIMSFTPAGFCSDKYPKHLIMRASAWVAVALTGLITLFYYQGWFWLAFAMTFILALQSAFYSPAKYGYIKERVGKEQLSRMNGLVQATTITAILLGLLFFSILFEALLAGTSHTDKSAMIRQIAVIGWGLVWFSLIEAVLCFFIPQTRACNTHMRYPWRPYLRGECLQESLRDIGTNPMVLLSIIGLAVFWSISQVMLASFPAYAKETMHIVNTVFIQGTMAWAGIGIIIGSLLAVRASGAHIETGLVPTGMAGIALCLFLLPWLDTLWLQSVNFLIWGIFGGLLIVPLNALIQFHARENQLGQVLAANNLLQNLAMFCFLVLTVMLSFIGVTSHGLFILLLAVALVGAAYIIYKLPQSMLRFWIAWVVGRQYHIRVLGLRRIPEKGGVLMLGNHISWLDWAVIQIASPRPIRFVMYSAQYKQLPLQWLMHRFHMIRVERHGSAVAVRTIRAALNHGELVCLFPEGAISHTGQLGKFQKDFEKAADDAQGVILPFYIGRLWGSRFSRVRHRLNHQNKDCIHRERIVAFGEPLALCSRVETVRQQVSELGQDAWEQYSRQLPDIPRAFIDTALRKRHHVLVVDETMGRLSGARLLRSVLCLASVIRYHTPGQNAGVLLPASGAGVICNLAILMLGKTVVNLNFTAAPQALRAAIRQADIDTVYTSERFLQRLGKKGIPLNTALDGCRLLALESLHVSAGRKLLTFISVYLLPPWLIALIRRPPTTTESTAAILFSSGSEGTPKGVLLSHRNIMSNIKQSADMLNIEPQDILLSSLPLFHAFGMTVGTFMPLVEGMPIVCHPDPLDVVSLSRTIARYRISLLCGTTTFLRPYIQNPRVHPLMLESVRMVISGAEKLPAEVREAFHQKFGKHVYEGYGATETSPVASMNVPDGLDNQFWQVQQGHKPGTVGRPVPGTGLRIVDPDTLRTLPHGRDGLILISGPQRMQGYLNEAEKTREVLPKLDGKRWYKSGDKGHVDKDGFLTIVDRFARFAKIGGEMISLSAVEVAARKALQDDALELLALSTTDARKGEKLWLLVVGDCVPTALQKTLRQSDMPRQMLPAKILPVTEIPKLGSGKTDYVAARRLIEPKSTQATRDGKDRVHR